MQPVSPPRHAVNTARPATTLPKAPHPGRQWETVVQGLLLAIGSAFALAPPVEGAMLIAPLLPGESAASLGWARDAGAELIAPGPYSGSYVVKGSLPALLLPALSHGTLLLTARLAACGATRSEDF